MNYGVTSRNGFVAASTPVHHIVKVALYSFKALIHLLHANKGAENWFTFVSKSKPLGAE